MVGYEDGTFRLGGFITRAELAKLIVVAFKCNAQTQTDYVDATNHWAKEYIDKTAGIIQLIQDSFTSYSKNSVI